MNLAWKILGITAALFLAAAAIISYLGKDAVKQELVLAKRAKSNLEATRTRAVEADDSLKEHTTAFEQAEKDRDAAAKQVEEIEAEDAEDAATIAERNVQLEQIKKQVADVKAKVQELGSIEKLLADVEKIEKQIADTENEIVNRDQKLRIAVEKVEAINDEIDDFTELERRQRKALVAEDFKASVASVFPNWGFVLLDKGNRDGVYANAELEIERNGQTLGRLFVTRVEQDRSVANLVTNTWPGGSLPQQGDAVVRAPLPEVETTPQAEEAPISPSDFGFVAPDDQPTDTDDGGSIFDIGNEAPEEDRAAPASDPFGGF